MDEPTTKDLNEIKIAIYRHYQELARNEDRLFNERLMLCFVGHSILFAGFIMSFEYSSLHLIRIVLPSVGIVLSVCKSIFLALPAKKAWEIWKSKLQEVEKDFEESGLTVTPPYKAGAPVTKWGRLPWKVGCWLLPSMFFILWLVSLVIAITN